MVLLYYFKLFFQNLKDRFVTLFTWTSRNNYLDILDREYIIREFYYMWTILDIMLSKEDLRGITDNNIISV